MKTPQTQYEYFAIIFHPTEPRVLIQRTENEWTIPNWQTTSCRNFQIVDDFIRAIRRNFGWKITILDCLYAVQNADMRCTRAWYLAEMHDRHSIVSSAYTQWIEFRELLNIVGAEHRTILENCFTPDFQNKLSERPPWGYPGWFQNASNWIERQLSALKIKTLGAIEQLRTWERCCLLRVSTDKGHVYFKALPKMFAHEISLIHLLAERFPESFVELLAADKARGWMLMREMKGRPITRITEAERWCEALRQYAEIQIYTISQKNQLTLLGCPNRPLDKLKRQIKAAARELPAYDCLPSIDEHRLLAKCMYLEGLCDELAQYNIPNSLEHGDFWSENILVHNKRFRYFDWSDSSISHPFFSLCLFLSEDIKTSVSHLPGIRQRLRDSYLSSWTRYEPMNRLLKAFDLAQQLAVAHNIVTYHRYILPQIQAKWQVENMLLYYARLLLK